jgi:hypothetical protein
MSKNTAPTNRRQLLAARSAANWIADTTKANNKGADQDERRIHPFGLFLCLDCLLGLVTSVEIIDRICFGDGIFPRSTQAWIPRGEEVPSMTIDGFR